MSTERLPLSAEAPELGASVPMPGPRSPGVDARVLALIEAYRQHGHRCAPLDPLGQAPRAEAADWLAAERFGLAPQESIGSVAPLSVAQLQARLHAVYCGPLSLDCSAVRDDERRRWLHQQFEAEAPACGDVQLAALHARWQQAQDWERHMARRQPQAKRFSLEGCEALLPLVDALLAEAAQRGLSEIFMGMPHRGRVNLLINLLGMKPAQVFDYFEARPLQPELQRDLVYHLGLRSRISTPQGAIWLNLAHNPSHLQSIYPVVLGMTRGARSGRAASLMLHGDAAFAGQGVVMESLMLARRPGYTVRGTIHILINNQLGFTEPNPLDGRQAQYASDIARMVDAPVLRLNAEALAELPRAARMAAAYRERFGCDVLIDLVGYRRLGHSEHDLPTLTSPRLYAVVARHEGLEGNAAQVTVFADEARAPGAGSPEPESTQPPAQTSLWREAPIGGQHELRQMVEAMCRLPMGFKPHALVAELIAHWRQSLSGDLRQPIDWCLAENLAYGTLLRAGIGLRLTGMDVCRGTFMHRQAVWYDQQPGSGGSFMPLRQVAGATPLEVINSPLSEEAVLGYEYGHSVQDRSGLSLWEAQFGDFVNGAQVYIDQYLSCGEEKWGCPSGLVLLLPHGYEGIGPEHSSAFLSRFLLLCGADNLRVVCPSSSAQHFHLLRRQALDPQRKPLVVMAPKTRLYKQPASHAPLSALLDGEFQPVLDDPDAGRREASRVLLCSGKLFYDLLAARASQGPAGAHIALLRLEELYPFPRAALERLLRRYPHMDTLVWAQEETLNQGAWFFVRDELQALCPSEARLLHVARPNTAAGATASQLLHQREQEMLVNQALGVAAPTHSPR
ncbi:thiamine pyrophosphate-dependent enzyme [Roseateles sp.]|jgi:2-oxoglutarate dehydrogenase E1 component|uniref:thiamine pyrophosphate-dependent enzyme n=1 Tax=Roseateles sp. TaxID=1971397 RepID=UPI00391CBC91